jgi:hypothetical protein
MGETGSAAMTEEEKRVKEAGDDPNGWRLWGPYLAERAWGTVPEDYSADGNAWDYFPHDHARSRAYRWKEDGIAGLSDIRQFLCFALALWNGKDPILKERMFGLTGHEGNHGEDVKEYYFYLDATPTHSYLKMLYKYPQAAYPYADLVETNRNRSRQEFEYELLDTEAFAENRYFDVFVEYAKAAPEDICIRITACNRGPEAASLHLLPTLWFRNTWGWGYDERRPSLHHDAESMRSAIRAAHYALGSRYLVANTCDVDGEGEGGGACIQPQFLFTENETNNERLFGKPNATPYVKDAFNERILHDREDAVNPAMNGTKAAIWYPVTIPAGGSATLKLRLTTDAPGGIRDFFRQDNFDSIFDARIAEADAFYAQFTPEEATLSDDARAVQRQAYAGLIWSRQFYHYDVETWLNGDPNLPPPPVSHRMGRNSTWKTADMRDVLSMPDTWEYPWFAAWDLAFHCIPFAQIDPDFAKHQLILLCREWFMHPNGQLPAYEWAFSDVNPPVHAWAALRVYKIERKMKGKGRGEPGDCDFLERIFHKLLLNFTWWVNRKDAQGNNIFEGGFLGLDNIGVFDRSAMLPNGISLEQCDGTAWMAMFSLNMLAIALELARIDSTYQDVAIKFAEHFVYIAYALTQIGESGISMWDEEDGFFYDVLHESREGTTESVYEPLRIHSVVGLIPLLAVEAFDSDALAAAPDFLERMDWFLRHKPQLTQDIAHITKHGQQDRILFSLVSRSRLRRILSRVFSESEFLSPYGIRSVSRWHRDHPYSLNLGGMEYRIDYEPAESTTGLFGGNSNWRGPVWFPINYLLIEALQKYDYVYGTDFLTEFPTGSGQTYDLYHIAALLSRRLSSLFLRDSTGRRPVYGGTEVFQNDSHWRDNVLFHEYFHGDNGAGLGASHQTGWTGLVAKLLSQSGA